MSCEVSQNIHDDQHIFSPKLQTFLAERSWSSIVVQFYLASQWRGEGGGSIVVHIKNINLISSDLYFLWKILISLFIITLKYFYFVFLFILSIFCINFLNFQFAE